MPGTQKVAFENESYGIFVYGYYYVCLSMYICYRYGMFLPFDSIAKIDL